MKMKKHRSYLRWQSYRLVSKLTNDRKVSETVNDFDCSRDSSNSNQSFPPLFFSRVKSFAVASDGPLA